MLDRRSSLFVLLGAAVAAVAVIAMKASASDSSPALPASSTPSESGDSRPMSMRGLKCLVLGDSLAVGLGIRLRFLAEEDGCKATVNAEVSTTTGNWAGQRFEAALKRDKPDFVIVSLGTNDAGMFNPETARPSIQRIVDAAKQAGVRIYWVGPPTLPSRLRGAEAVRDMIRATGVPYFESQQLAFERAADGVHATMAGYATWAEAVWKWVRGQESK